MRENERRVFLLRDGHVEADVGHFHDVTRTGVQLYRGVWNVLFDADQSHAVSATPVTKQSKTQTNSGMGKLDKLPPPLRRVFTARRRRKDSAQRAMSFAKKLVLVTAFEPASVKPNKAIIRTHVGRLAGLVKLKFHWEQFPRNFLADLLATSPTSS